MAKLFRPHFSGKVTCTVTLYQNKGFKPALDVSFDTKLTSFFLHICFLKSCTYKPFSYHHLLAFARDQLLSAILQFSLSHAHLGNVRKNSLLTTQNALSPQKCTRYSRRLVVNVASMAVIVASTGSNRREYTSCTNSLRH